MTSDVNSSKFHSSAAVDDEMSSVPATATTPDDVRPTPVTPVDVSDFDYYLFLDDLGSVRQLWSDDPAFMPTAVVYGLAFVFGFLGNLFVALALLVDRRQRAVLAAANGGNSHHLTTSFLVSLAIADVVFLLVCLPYELVVKLESVWSGGLALCKLAGFVEMITATASVLNLSAVSIERYIAIVHPLKSRTWCSVGRIKKVIAAVWITSALLSSPLLYFMGMTDTLYYNADNYVVMATCADNNFSSDETRIAFAWYQLVVVFLLPAATMAYCYTFVIRVLWLSTKRLATLTQADSSSRVSSISVHRVGQQQNVGGIGHRQSRGVRLVKPNSAERSLEVAAARKQVIRMLLAIIGVFFCCWGPKCILNVLKRHQFDILYTDDAFYVMLVIHLLPYAQSSVNPFIYSFMSHNFRCTVRSLWHRLRDQCRRRGRLGGVGGRHSTDWNFIEMAAEGRSARTTSLANTRVPRTIMLTV